MSSYEVDPAILALKLPHPYLWIKTEWVLGIVSPIFHDEKSTIKRGVNWHFFWYHTHGGSRPIHTICSYETKEQLMPVDVACVEDEYEAACLMYTRFMLGAYE
jgi:hypothetical protein